MTFHFNDFSYLVCIHETDRFEVLSILEQTINYGDELDDVSEHSPSGVTILEPVIPINLPSLRNGTSLSKNSNKL